MSEEEESHTPAIDLDAIRAEPVSVDEQSALEEFDFEVFAKAEKTRQELQAGEIENQERSDNLRARKKYARRIFILLCAWITLTYATVLACGHKSCPIELSDSVLIALITSGSVNIIGMFLVILNYLFPKR